MSFTRGSFAYHAAVGNHSEGGMWSSYHDASRKSKRKAMGEAQTFQAAQMQQQQQHNQHILQQQQQHEHHSMIHGPGIPLDPSLPPHHPMYPYASNMAHPNHPQHLQHQQHPSLSHSPMAPPVYDAAYPPRPPVIDPITSLPMHSNQMHFHRPASELHELFPNDGPNQLPPHHRRRPPLHSNPAIPVVGADYDSQSHPMAEMLGNDGLPFPARPPFDVAAPPSELANDDGEQEEEDAAVELKDDDGTVMKRRRMNDLSDLTSNQFHAAHANFSTPASTPCPPSPSHTSTNFSAVSMSPTYTAAPAPVHAAAPPMPFSLLPDPTPLSLSAQSTTRQFADISNVPSASSTSSISSSASSSFVPASPQLQCAPIASLVRSPMLRPLNGRYAHLQPITNKGFGATYKAWDLLTSKPVFLKRTVLSSRAFSQREASFMKLFTCFRRRNPGSLRFLVDYVDDFVCQLESNEAPCHWLALDYVSGGDLVQLLRECHSLARPLQEDDVRIIIHRLCEAIREMHLLRVVHMDVSLENICIQWLNSENNGDDVRVQLLLIDFEWSMMDMRGNALQQMVAQMDAEAAAASGTVQFQELQANAIEMRKAYEHVMLHPTPMHYYSDKYSRLRLQRRHEAVGKISYLSSEAKNLHSSFDPYKNEVFAIGASAYRLMFMCGPGEKNALTESRTISNEFLSFLTETFQPEDKRMHSEDMLAHPWLSVLANPNHAHHVRARSQSLAAAHQQLSSPAHEVSEKSAAEAWQQYDMDEKSSENHQ